MKRELNSVGALSGLITMSLSWTISNKSYPWLPAWNEGLAFASIFILWLAAAVSPRKDEAELPGIAWPLLGVIFLSIFMAWAQYFSGLLIFSGDAFLIYLYLSTLAISVHAGSLISKLKNNDEWIAAFIYTIIISATLSIGVAIIQWTKTWDFAVFIMEADIGDRPGANLGQTNNFSTLCFIAVCGVLYLHDRGRLQIFTATFIGLFLVFGMAITQSRTGWLQIMLICFLALFFQKNNSLKIKVLFLTTAFAAFYRATPILQTSALMTATQNFRDFSTHDVRLTMWSALLEASSMRPWFGYGWLQTGWAQQVTAESHPILRTYMSYSHNFALDLIIWNGWPIAIIFLSLLSIWFCRHLFCRNSNGELFLYSAAAGIFIHGMLEYPLAYAYFLLPAGIIMGYLDDSRSIFLAYRPKINRLWLFIIPSIVLFLVIGLDYIKAVPTDVAVRMRSAQIGSRSEPDESDVHFVVLNQLSAMYSVRSMSEHEYTDEKNIELMGKVAQRYPYSPALFQYALAKAMHGDFSFAEAQLKILCGIYSEAHCKILKTRWIIFQKKYPHTVGSVKFPEK